MVHVQCYSLYQDNNSTDASEMIVEYVSDEQAKEEKKMTVRMRGKMFGVLTVLLVLIIVLCVKGTVMSRGSGGQERRNHYYAALEQEYLEKTRLLLEEEGLRNCGVNIRWVDDGNGNREYTILLHHRNLNCMSEHEKAALEDMLSGIEFRDASCSFSYVIGL